MKQIPLTLGYIAIVDDKDYEDLSKYKWYAKIRSNTCYACRNLSIEEYRGFNISKMETMHRRILGITDKSIHVDHVNHNGIDNRRENLRLVTVTQNAANSKKKSKISKYKGISFTKGTIENPWRARIQPIKGHQIHLGYFSTQEEAAKAYNDAAKKFFKEYANLNKL